MSVVVDGVRVAACIGCGFCCRKAPCAVAVQFQKVDQGKCAALIWNGQRWRCELYMSSNEDKKYIAKALAIGAGCCCNLNDYRRKNIIPTPEDLRGE